MRILISVLLLIMFVPSYSRDARLPLLPRDAVVVAHPALLDPADPARRTLGGLTYLGGVWLSGKGAAFGGFSAIDVQGNRFTLLSDGGNIVSFTLDSRWRISAPHYAALPDGPGSGWAKPDRDSESMTRDPATGRVWVAFEGEGSTNEIWRYGPGLSRPARFVAPPAMADWPFNEGAEAMARLSDGSFLVFSERHRIKGRAGFTALWFAGDPIESPRRGFRFSYRPPRWFAVTDIAELPDGRLILLSRNISWRLGFRATVSIVDRAAIRPGAVVQGREIARFEAPVIHDNFEGIAVTQEHGQTIVWIVSDDNQLVLQRSLLLKFRLDV